MDLKIGITGKAQTVVNESNTAKSMGSGDLDVFATPSMIALMEKAATEAVKEYLPGGTSSVGTMINVKHTAATPVSMSVTAQATLTSIDGKRLLFNVEAYDAKEKIGEGQHERYIINAEKFTDRVKSKL